MLYSCSTNATVAKIRAIHGRMFTHENYREIMMRKSVPEAAQYLAQSKRYADAFREVDPNTVHRGYLEELLYRESFNTYIRLCRFQGLDGMPFFDFLIKKREIESILAVINDINSSLESTQLTEIPGYLIKHSQVKLLEVSAAGSYEELLRALKGTRYYKILVRIAPKEDGSADYTECELRLRTDYYSTLLEQVKSAFLKSEAVQLEEMILREIDGLNIINAYRMKAFFGFSPQEIKRRSIRFSQIGLKRMESLFECESAEAMLELVEKSIYGRDLAAGSQVEAAIRRRKFEYLNSVLAKSVSAPVSLYAFVQLCEIDVSNIVHIIEGIRYGADSELIASQLIMR